MAQTREFRTDEVLSAVTGRIVSPRLVEAIYDVLNWAAGESLMTHQLVRVMDELRPVMLARLPALQQACDEAEQVNAENWQQWSEAWFDRYGPTIAVPRLAEDQHESIDPLSELAERAHPSRIVIIERGR